jgi:hypothetical protein
VLPGDTDGGGGDDDDDKSVFWGLMGTFLVLVVLALAALLFRCVKAEQRSPTWSSPPGGRSQGK